jgi:hypothetical protein
MQAEVEVKSSVINFASLQDTALQDQPSCILSESSPYHYLKGREVAQTLMKDLGKTHGYPGYRTIGKELFSKEILFSWTGELNEYSILLKHNWPGDRIIEFQCTALTGVRGCDFDFATTLPELYDTICLNR